MAQEAKTAPLNYNLAQAQWELKKLFDVQNDKKTTLGTNSGAVIASLSEHLRQLEESDVNLEVVSSLLPSIDNVKSLINTLRAIPGMTDFSFSQSRILEDHQFVLTWLTRIVAHRAELIKNRQTPLLQRLKPDSSTPSTAETLLRRAKDLKKPTKTRLLERARDRFNPKNT